MVGRTAGFARCHIGRRPTFGNVCREIGDVCRGFPRNANFLASKWNHAKTIRGRWFQSRTNSNRYAIMASRSSTIFEKPFAFICLQATCDALFAAESTAGARFPRGGTRHDKDFTRRADPLGIAESGINENQNKTARIRIAAPSKGRACGSATWKAHHGESSAQWIASHAPIPLRRKLVDGCGDRPATCQNASGWSRPLIQARRAGRVLHFGPPAFGMAPAMAAWMRCRGARGKPILGGKQAKQAAEIVGAIAHALRPRSSANHGCQWPRRSGRAPGPWWMHRSRAAARGWPYSTQSRGSGHGRRRRKVGSRISQQCR